MYLVSSLTCRNHDEWNIYSIHRGRKLLTFLRTRKMTQPNHYNFDFLTTKGGSINIFWSSNQSTRAKSGKCYFVFQILLVCISINSI